MTAPRPNNFPAVLAASQESDMQRFNAPSPLRRGMGFTAIALAALAVAATARSQPAGAPGSWTAKAPLPVARNEGAAVALNDRIYVLGLSYPPPNYDLPHNPEYNPPTHPS